MSYTDISRQVYSVILLISPLFVAAIDILLDISWAQQESHHVPCRSVTLRISVNSII